MSASKTKNIIFYFPYKGVGGVSVLFLEFAQLLTADFAVHIVDFKDGYMGRRIPQGVNFIDFEKVITYPANSIVVLQSVPLYRIKDFYKFDKRTSFLSWNLHPRNFEPLDLQFDESKQRSFVKKNLLGLFLSFQKWNKRKIEKTIRYLSKKNALFFMDNENFVTTQAFFPRTQIAEKYLPCFISGREELKNGFSPKPLYRFCWVGRVVDFKVHILLHLLKRLSAVYGQIPEFEFTVIGSGDQDEFMKKEIASLNLPFNIHFTGDISKELVGKYLVENCDILFGMGLSALEGAARRIPVFLVDFSYTEIKDNYKFKLVSEHENFNLGSEINSSHLETASTFAEKLQYIFGHYDQVASSCFNYWNENHSGAKTADIFKKHLSENQAAKLGLLLRGFNIPDIFTFLYFSFIKVLRVKKGSGVHGFRYPSAN